MRRETVSARALAGAMLAALALLGLVLVTGSILHTHTGLGPGLHNQEHDLILLAAFEAAASTPEVPVTAQVPVTQTSPPSVSTCSRACRSHSPSEPAAGGSCSTWAWSRTSSPT